MKLTDGEKLIALMLSDLYEKLDIKSEIDPEFIRSAIYGDQLWALKWKYSGIPFEESNDPEIVKEVVDILDMWSFIERGYNRLTAKQKNELDIAVPHFGKDPKFEGFDGNNETDYMATALFLVEELDRFREFSDRDFNCHHASIDSHRRMLNVFEPIRGTLMTSQLSVGQLTAILQERVHPSNRK
jgi:uncharacterized protein YfbU (UPF0304 family)